jgi:hypothetical protein
LYILERLLSWSTSRIRPSWPHPQVRLNLLPALFHMYLPCLSRPTQYLAVCSKDSFSHVHPPLTTGRLNTSTQVNNMAMLHLIYHRHIYVHHIIITVRLFLHTSSIVLGRLASPDPSRLEHFCSIIQCSIIQCIFLFWYCTCIPGILVLITTTIRQSITIINQNLPSFVFPISNFSILLRAGRDRRCKACSPSHSHETVCLRFLIRDALNQSMITGDSNQLNWVRVTNLTL